MSWILGTIGIFTEAEKERISALHPRPLSIMKTNSISIAAGGIPSTCLMGKFTPSQTTDWHTWLIAGLGMRREKDHGSFYSAAQWNSVLAVQQPDFSPIDGHFVALRFNDNEIQIFTDRLGMRSFYAAKTARGVVFSTRLDWVARLRIITKSILNRSGRNGLHWIRFHAGVRFAASIALVREAGRAVRQLRSSIRNRYGTRIPIPISMGKTDSKKHSNHFSCRGMFPRNRFHSVCPEDWIRDYCLPCTSAMGEKNLKLHVFGDSLDPDVIISKQIAHRLKLSHIHEQYIPQSSEELLSVCGSIWHKFI